MDLSGSEERGDVEDRRGYGKLAAGGGIGAMVLAAIGYFAFGDPNALQGLNPGGGGQQKAGPAPKDGYEDFSELVLGSINHVWKEQLPKQFKHTYEPPKMILFRDGVKTGCGNAPSSVGPFYCPRDQMVYLDPTFFEELEGKLGGSKAKFSQAYVVAHECGHHVQNLVGYNKQLDEFKNEGPNAGIRLELQADYLAGVWAHYAKDPLKLDTSDINSAITTAQAIGDDKIQKKSQGWASPEKFTHGTAEQRVKMFKKGFESGDASKKTLDHFFDRNINPLKL